MMASRHDHAIDPGLRLMLMHARRGTAFFARKLNEMADSELDHASLLPGWTRRHVVAHVGNNARALARLVNGAALGVVAEMYSSPTARMEEIQLGATSSPAALRSLFAHTAVHLNVEWRDLAEDSWHRTLRTARGRLVPASETVWMRIREVWVHAVDLDSGASFADIPEAVLAGLLVDVAASWDAQVGIVPRLSVSGRPSLTPTQRSHGIGPVVSGALPDLVAWACGRGRTGLTVSEEVIPTPPPWL